ncbi:alpha/beta hydrolase [soil metagenome]
MRTRPLSFSQVVLVALMLCSQMAWGSADIGVAAQSDPEVTVLANQQYRDGDDDALLDVYFPNAETRLPTIVWTHGGAWVAGSKDDHAPYYELLASEGYTVISLNYSLGGSAKYPTAIFQINEAFAFIQESAEQFRVNTERIVLAGDSAGAQITSQLAAIITNPEFAAEMEITPSLQPEQLRGVVLYCGIYDIPTFLEQGDDEGGVAGGMFTVGTSAVIGIYTGSSEPDSVAAGQMSTINHVTADFPPAFISGGNNDPLTDTQSVPFAAQLNSLGIETTTLFFLADHEPALGHEYQFDLDLVDAQNAFTQMLDFLTSITD